MTQETSDPLLKVYYNSACPVCKAGIDFQRARMEKEDTVAAVQWIDVADTPGVLAPLGLDIDDVRRSLHVARGNDIHIGADAFIALAKTTRGQGWLARVFGNRFILPLSRFVYNRFADMLLWWNRKRQRW